MNTSTADQAPASPSAAVPMAAPAAAHMANTFRLATVSRIPVTKARPGPTEVIAVIHFGACADAVPRQPAVEAKAISATPMTMRT